MTGSHGKPDLCTGLTFRGVTGPDVSIRISARIRCSKVTSFSSEFRTAFGSLERGRHPDSGTATAAHRRSLFGACVTDKDAEVRLEPQEPPVRTLFASAFSSGQAGSGHRSSSPSALWCREDAFSFSLRFGVASRGSRLIFDGCDRCRVTATDLSVMVTTGVACRPQPRAALRLFSSEVWPDARCGPVRGKATSKTLSFRTLNFWSGADISGPWDPGAGGSGSFESYVGGQETETLVLP